MEMGEERLCCGGSDATRTLTHVPHRDAIAAVRSLHLPAEGEATSPIDLHGTREGGAVASPPPPCGDLRDAVTPASPEEGW